MNQEPDEHEEPRRFSADQQALEGVIAAALTLLESPIPVASVRAVLAAAASRDLLRGDFARLYQSEPADSFRELLTDCVFTADVLGYWAAHQRFGNEAWSHPGPHAAGSAPSAQPQSAAGRSAPRAPLAPAAAIDWARRQRVVLPDVYYGGQIALARAMAFSITGLTKMHQLQVVYDAIDSADGADMYFDHWCRQSAVTDDDRHLTLPPEHLERILREAMQGQYSRGRCEWHRSNTRERPYLVYDAGNDPRDRAGHWAMHGLVAPFDDPVWRRWRPPCGQGCRCRVVSLTATGANRLRTVDQRRLHADPALAAARAQSLRVGPDVGWDFDLCMEPTAALRREIEQMRAQCGESEEPVDGSEFRASAPPLSAASQPREVTDQERAVLAAIEERFHALIRARCQEFHVPVPDELPRLREPWPRSSRQRKGLNIKGMYGGFGWWFEGDGETLRLITESWSRVIGYSSQRHEITATDSRLLNAGWV